MPILYIHGVAMREEGQDGWETLKSTVGDVAWSAVQSRLHQYLAPALNTENPDAVRIEQVSWGELGARPKPKQPASAEQPAPASLTPNDLAERLELQMRRTMPHQLWPEVIEAAWHAAHDADLRPQWEPLPADKQWRVLEKQVEGELRRIWRSRFPLDPWPRHQQLGQNLRVKVVQKVAQLRGQVEEMMPYFLGDIVKYLGSRGTPAQPGPIQQRVLTALREMQAIKQQTDEPLIVVTYSMGGQLFYDAMNAFVPAQSDLQDLKVDFWCAAGSQLGLFAALDLFWQEDPTQPLSKPAQVAYLWNAWSPSDLLSFAGAGLIEGAQDIVVGLTQDATKAHAAYMTDPMFYEALRRKIRMVTTYCP